ncbi:MAG: hypothetical protein WC436_03045 [Candidatus Babeliales bacterium]
MKEEATTFYENYGYYYKPFWQTTYFKFFSFFLIFILVVLALYFIFKFFLKKRKKEFLPWEWALQELNKFDFAKFTSKKDYKKFYFDLTCILKKYLEKRFNWHIQDKTDEELVIFLKEKKFDGNLLSGIENLLQGALTIKFAGQDILKIQADKDLKIAFDLIKNTIPVEQNKN